MAYNPSLDELFFLFKDRLDEGVIQEVYYDLHQQGSEAMKILEALQNNERLKRQQNNSGTQPEVGGPTSGGNEARSGIRTRDASRSGNERVPARPLPRTVDNNTRPLPRTVDNKPFNTAGRTTISNSITDRRAVAQTDRVRIPGYHDSRAMYIMRGLSGSGKSTYARKIIEELRKGEIFSTDDFFMLNEENEYRFVHEKLDTAHKWNQERVEGAMQKGVSPILVDNTNTQFWEMRPYVIASVERGYSCYFIEPPTKWKFNIGQLHKKSSHGLHKGQLVAAFRRYEKNPTVEAVLGSYCPKIKTNMNDPYTHEEGYVPYKPVAQPGAKKQGRSTRDQQQTFSGSTRDQQQTSSGSTRDQQQSFSALVPYLSDSSDEDLNERNMMREATRHSRDHSACATHEAPSHYREYNNNCSSPKVRTEGHVGEGDLGSDNLTSFRDREPEGSQRKISSRTQETDENLGEEIDQDMAEWLDSIAERDMEDQLLEQLESQNSARLEEEVEEMLDQKQVHANSAAKLCSWEEYLNTCTNEDKNQKRLPDGEEKAAEGLEEGLMTAEVPRNGTLGAGLMSEAVDADEMAQLGNLQEICRARVKTLMRISYYRGPQFLKAYNEAMGLPIARCNKELPAPRQISAEDVLQSAEASEEEEEESKTSPDIMEYATVSHDTIGLSPNSAPPEKRRLTKMTGIAEEKQSHLLAKRNITAHMTAHDCSKENMEEKRDETREDLKELVEYPQEEETPCNLYPAREGGNVMKLVNNTPPSIRTLLELDKIDKSDCDEDSAAGGGVSGVSTGGDVSDAIPEADKPRYDSADDTEVGSLALPPKLVKTLTNLFGTIVGIPTDQSIRIPVNLELASQLHSALYFAHTNGKTVGTKGKDRMKRVEIVRQCPPPVVASQLTRPFNEIVQYQSQLPEKTERLKRLVDAYPGADEKFLSEVLTSCGNEVQRAFNLLQTSPVHLQCLDDMNRLYSSRTAEQRCTPTHGGPKTEAPIQYTHLSRATPHSNYPDTLIVRQSGTLVEQAESYGRLAAQAQKQAGAWHQRKQYEIARHYGYQATKYRELADEKEMEIFAGTISSKLRSLRSSPVLDLHGYTLPQSKYLLTQALLHVRTMIGQDTDYPTTLSVMTGKGLHSSGGVSKLKPGIRALLNSENVQYLEEDDGYKLKFRT